MVHLKSLRHKVNLRTFELSVVEVVPDRTRFPCLLCEKKVKLFEFLKVKSVEEREGGVFGSAYAL